MKHVIIGTAGHIDHGKTALIRALTGIETDRLKEEKARGITIDLGFAYFDLPSGRRAGIIDVPGHEKLIKNMLAGAGGMDTVILVVAADEGVMPQTEEHLNILELLKVKKGVIAVTKTDIVDNEWLELVIEDIKKRVKGSFLENAPIIPVSSKTGYGLDKLVSAVDKMTEEVDAKKLGIPFRMPIDRVFTVKGFGTVVTGTLLSGKITVDQNAEIMPQQILTRLRSIQVHNEDTITAEGGQRVAANIAGVKPAEVKRGDVVAAPGLLKPTLLLDARLQVLKNAPRAIKNLERIRLYLGSKEVLARVIVLDKKLIYPGESALVQFRLEEKTTALSGDRFVIRSYSPMVTIGGGLILDPLPEKEKPFNKETIKRLELIETSAPEEVLEQIIMLKSHKHIDRNEVFRYYGREDFDNVLGGLIKRGKVKEVSLSGRSILLHETYLNKLKGGLIDAISIYHRKNPLKSGIPKEELRERTGLDIPFFQYIIEMLLAEKIIKSDGKTVSLKDFRITFTPEQENVLENIKHLFEEKKYSPPGIDDIVIKLDIPKPIIVSLMNAASEIGIFKKIKDDFFLPIDLYIKSKEAVLKVLNDRGEITVAEVRDLLNTSRKYALPLLEHFDEIGFTKRIGDKRIPGAGIKLDKG